MYIIVKCDECHDLCINYSMILSHHIKVSTNDIMTYSLSPLDNNTELVDRNFLPEYSPFFKAMQPDSSSFNQSCFNRRKQPRNRFMLNSFLIDRNQDKCIKSTPLILLDEYHCLKLSG